MPQPRRSSGPARVFLSSASCTRPSSGREAWDSYRKSIARERYVAPSTKSSQDSIRTVDVELAGVDRTMAFVEDWQTVDGQTVTCHAVLVLCSKNTAYTGEGLSARMEALSSTKLCVVVIGRRPEVAGDVDTLMGGPSGRGLRAVLITLTIDLQGRHDEWSDTLFLYSATTPEGAKGDRCSSHRSLWLTVVII